MRRRVITIIAGLGVLGGIAAGGTALASGRDGGQTTSGPEAEQARVAALQHVGGGTANSVERDSENGATWEVEVTTTDGNTVDVRLDAGYNPVIVEGDSEQAGESENDAVQNETGVDAAVSESEAPGGEAETPGDDGSGGHADEPENPDADHQFEGNE